MNTLIRWSWVFGLIGTLCLVGAVSVWYVSGAVEGWPTRYFVAGAGSLVLYVLLDRDRLGEAATGKALRNSSVAALIVVVSAAVAISAYSLSRRYDKTWDLTGERQFTLSEQTLTVLAGLPYDVEAIAFLRGGASQENSLRPLLERFSQASDRIRVRYVDPLKEPRLAEKYEIGSGYGTLILAAPDGSTQRLETRFTEDNLTNRLVILSSGVEHTVCWAVGHGEGDPDDDMDERGFGAIRTMLEAANYQVMRSDVLKSGIDRACKLLVIARPQTDWLDWEREALAAYVAEGGGVFLMIEPDAAPGLSQDLERFGIEVGDDIVFDLNPENLMAGGDPTLLVLGRDNVVYHDITRDLGAALILGLARSVSPMRDLPGLQVEDLLLTSADAWAETDLRLEEEPTPGAHEKVGRVPLMVVSEVTDPAVLDVAPHDDTLGRAVPAALSPEPGGRVVVVGDSDFATKGFVAWGNNRDLFLNTIAWLADEENQIGERADAAEQLEMTAASSAVLCLVSVIFVPGSVFLLGAITLIRRRYL